MIYNGEEQLVKDLKAQALFPVYVIYGQEAFLKELYTKKISDKTVESGIRDFNLNRFEGKKLTMDALFDAVEALPLMAQRRCVIVEDLDIEKMGQSDHKKLCEILENPPETTVLILEYKDIVIDPKKSAKSKKVLELADKNGGAVFLGGRTRSQLAKFVKSKCEKQGCSISAENANYIVERCSENMGILHGETEKLCAYVGAGEITRTAIDRITTAAVEAGVFDLSKAILRGDYSGSMEILSDLLYLKEQPVTILSTLSFAFIDLYRAKVGKNSGKMAVEVIADFDYKRREFRINNAYRDCGRYSEEMLRRILELIIQTDYKLKSAKTEDRILLEQLITELFIELQKEGRI